MRYLAVKHKGLYICNNELEEEEMIELFRAYTTNFFEEYEEDEAKEWAENDKIIGFKREEEKEHEFIEVLKKYRKQGYGYVDITLINGQNISIIIDNITFLSTKYRCTWNYSKKELEVNQMTSYLEATQLESDFKVYYDEVKSSKTKEDALRNFLKTLRREVWGRPWTKFNKTNVKIDKTIITFNVAYNEIQTDSHYPTYELGCKINDISIILSNIIMITPQNIKNEVKNKELKKMMNEIGTGFLW